jgi:hypothetical protein
MLTFLLGFIPGAEPFVALLGRNKLLNGVLNGLVIAAAMWIALGVFGHIEFGRGEKHERAKWEAASAAAAKRNAEAVAASDAQRSVDTNTVATSEKGRTDAIHAGPDAAPSGPELRLACQRLRAQRVSEARLPVACRLGGPAQAAAQR